MNKLWGGRFSKPSDKLAEKYSESISLDYRLYKHDINGSIAHVKMLGRKRIIPTSDASKIISALNKLGKIMDKQIAAGKFKYDSGTEDIHSYIESEVTRLAGREAGAKMHTARSRNDQVSLDMRLYIRQDAGQMAALLDKLCGALNKTAQKNGKVIMPGYTHMQVAKPIKFKDHLGAYVEMFGRDISRLKDCSKRLNYSPLGAGAIGGTSFNVDRHFTAKQLKFAGVMNNLIDAVSDRDFVLEYVFCLSMIMMHLRFLNRKK